MGCTGIGAALTLGKEVRVKAWLFIVATACVFWASAQTAISGEAWVSNQPPVVVATIPRAGEAMVDPGLKEIRIEFSKPMRTNGWSLVMQDKASFPKISGKLGFENGGLTFGAQVKLKPGKEYVIWINSGRYQNFRDQQGRPAVPYLLSFRTRP